MAQKLYDAFLMDTQKEGTAEFLRNIDLFNLPYDRMGVQNPLVILGDVDMGNSKGRQWPDFTHVGIIGTFDCSHFTIGPDTILPGYFKKLICKHSISDLKVLINILQDIEAHDCTVVVRTALLNKIKRNENGALDIAREFAKIHPSITVTDDKQTLAKILAEIDAPSVRVTEPVKTMAPAVPEIPLQTEEYLSVAQVVPTCANALAPDLLQNLPKGLERYIQQAFSKVSTVRMRSTDGKGVVVCVHMSEVTNVIDLVIEYIQKDIEQSAKKQKAHPKSPAAKIVKQPLVADAQPQSGGTKIVPQKIKKYISKSVWKQIKKATGTSKNILLQILQDVQDINIVPTETGAVHYIKDGEETISSNVEFRGNCLSQRFDKTNNRPRIVWGIDGNVFVCRHYFADHGDNDRIEYAETLNKINLDISKLDLKRGFLLVSNLIKNLTKTTENGTSLTAESEASVEPDSTDQSEPKATDAIEPEATEQLVEAETAATTVSEPVVEKSAQTDTRKEYIAPTITVKVITGPGIPDDGDDSKPVVDTSSDTPQQSEQPTAKQKTHRPRMTRDPQKVYTTRKPKGTHLKPNFDTTSIAEMPEPEWVDIAKVYHEYITLYTEYSEREKIVSGKKATATGDELRKLNKEMRTILTAKRDIENALKTIRKSNSILQAQERKLLLLNSK